MPNFNISNQTLTDSLRAQNLTHVCKLFLYFKGDYCSKSEKSLCFCFQAIDFLMNNQDEHDLESSSDDDEYNFCYAASN